MSRARSSSRSSHTDPAVTSVYSHQFQFDAFTGGLPTVASTVLCRVQFVAPAAKVTFQLRCKKLVEKVNATTCAAAAAGSPRAKTERVY